MKNDKVLKNLIIYEIFVRSFCDSNNDGIGDIKGIISKLDYLKDLGVNAIWLTPIYVSPNEDSGYDVSDYYQINKEFGNMDDIKKLIEEAHIRNIKIIFEIVANHTSSKHKWFESAKKSKTSKYRDYYIWRDNVNDKFPNNWISSRTGKSVWTYVKETNSYYLHLYTPHQPDLNWRNENLRKEILKIMKFWLNFGVDAFRLDVINKISKKDGLPDVDENVENGYAELYFENQPEVHDYIHNIRKEIEKEYPNCLLIGQTSGVNTEQAYKYTLDEKRQLDLFLQFEHTDMDKGPLGTLKKFDLEKFKSIIFKWQNAYDGKLINTVFLGSHDLPRMASHYGNKDYFEKSVKMLATVQLFLRGTQIIYMGDEIGMTNANYNLIDDYSDIRTKDYYYKRISENEEKDEVFKDIQKISRDNARTPMQWNDSKYAGFSNIKPWIKENVNYDSVNVKKQISDDNSILNYYKKLINLRKTEEILIEGKTNEIDLGNNLIAYNRRFNNKKITVIANYSNKIKYVDLSCYGKKIIINYKKCYLDKLMPYEVQVFKETINE